MKRMIKNMKRMVKDLKRMNNSTTMSIRWINFQPVPSSWQPGRSFPSYAPARFPFLYRLHFHQKNSDPRYSFCKSFILYQTRILLSDKGLNWTRLYSHYLVFGFFNNLFYLVFCVDEFETGLSKQLRLEEKVHQRHHHDFIFFNIILLSQ